MPPELLKNTNEIERLIISDRVNTPYKYSLLCAVIDYCQQHADLPPNDGEEFVTLPLSAVIEKWIEYYYPLFNSNKFIALIHTENSPSPIIFCNFRQLFKKICNYYNSTNNSSSFLSDLKNNTVPPQIQPDTDNLINILSHTILLQPMKHLGFSVYNRNYAIFSLEKTHFNNIISSPQTEYKALKSTGFYRVSEEWYRKFSGEEGKSVLENGILYSQWLAFLKGCNTNTDVTEKELRALIPSILIEPINYERNSDTQYTYTNESTTDYIKQEITQDEYSPIPAPHKQSPYRDTTKAEPVIPDYSGKDKFVIIKEARIMNGLLTKEIEDSLIRNGKMQIPADCLKFFDAESMTNGERYTLTLRYDSEDYPATLFMNEGDRGKRYKNAIFLEWPKPLSVSIAKQIKQNDKTNLMQLMKSTIEDDTYIVLIQCIDE